MAIINGKSVDFRLSLATVISICYYKQTFAVDGGELTWNDMISAQVSGGVFSRSGCHFKLICISLFNMRKFCSRLFFLQHHGRSKRFSSVVVNERTDAAKCFDMVIRMKRINWKRVCSNYGKN